MPQTRVTTTPEDIYTAIADQLVSTGLFPAEHVFVNLEPQQGVAPPASVYVSLVPDGGHPWQPAVTGGGAHTFWIKEHLQTILWVRLWLDMAGRDDQLMMNKSLGALGKFRMTLAALQLFDPVNADSKQILCEPMRLADPGFRARPRKPQPGWGSLAATWELEYLMQLPELGG